MEPVDTGLVALIEARRPRCRGFSHPKGLCPFTGFPHRASRQFAARKRAQDGLRQRP